MESKINHGRSFGSEHETMNRRNFIEVFKSCPIPENELLSQLSLFINRPDLSRILFMHELYKKIIDVQGVIIEFGVKWGRDLSLFESFRGIYEPYNFTRKIIGFDTFAGFPSVHKKDGNFEHNKQGAYSVTEGYEQYLEAILNYHETESPLSHYKKFTLVKGDATVTINEYLKSNPDTIIAFAYFDLDLYEPTMKCLKAIKAHVTKGSIIGFDEFSNINFPGETIALKEVFGSSNVSIKRLPIEACKAYIVIE